MEGGTVDVGERTAVAVAVTVGATGVREARSRGVEEGSIATALLATRVLLPQTIAPTTMTALALKINRRSQTSLYVWIKSRATTPQPNSTPRDQDCLTWVTENHDPD